MPAKKMKRVKRNVVVPRKSEILKELCSSTEYEIIKEYARKGAVFIVLGSEHTDNKKFYKGLHQIMYSPSSNGGCIYDSNFQYKDASTRPYIAIALNDPVNADHVIDNIKLLDRYRSRTLYTVDYNKEEEEENKKKLEIAREILEILGYQYTLKATSKPYSGKRSYKLENVKMRDDENMRVLYVSIILSRLLSRKHIAHKELVIDEKSGRLLPIQLTGLFDSDAKEMWTLFGEAVNYYLYKQTENKMFDEVLYELAVALHDNRQRLENYLSILSSTGGTGYRCAQMLYKEIAEIKHVVISTEMQENPEQASKVFGD